MPVVWGGADLGGCWPGGSLRPQLDRPGQGEASSQVLRGQSEKGVGLWGGQRTAGSEWARRGLAGGVRGDPWAGRGQGAGRCVASLSSQAEAIPPGSYGTGKVAETAEGQRGSVRAWSWGQGHIGIGVPGAPPPTGRLRPGEE